MFHPDPIEPSPGSPSTASRGEGSSSMETLRSKTEFEHDGPHSAPRNGGTNFDSCFMNHEMEPLADDPSWGYPLMAESPEDFMASLPPKLARLYAFRKGEQLPSPLSLRYRNYHVFHSARPESFVHSGGPVLPPSGYGNNHHSHILSQQPPFLIGHTGEETEAVERVEEIPEPSIKIVIEDPSQSNFFCEKPTRTEVERARQKEDVRRLKNIGGACTACYRSKKKCGAGTPCPPCKRNGKKCTRKQNGIIPSHSGYDDMQPPSSGTSPGGGSPSNPTHHGKNTVGQNNPDPSVSHDNLPIVYSGVPSTQNQAIGGNDGNISPISWDLSGEVEEVDTDPDCDWIMRPLLHLQASTYTVI